MMHGQAKIKFTNFVLSSEDVYMYSLLIINYTVNDVE